jgi:hypothetical protein
MSQKAVVMITCQIEVKSFPMNLQRTLVTESNVTAGAPARGAIQPDFAAVRLAGAAYSRAATRKTFAMER